MAVLVSRVKEKYQREGLVPLVRSVPLFVQHRISTKRDELTGSNFHYQLIKSDGVEERWGLLEPHLEENTSVLDVGCNAGLFTKRAAERNRFSIGIEKNAQTVSDAVDYHGESREFGLINKSITRESVASLPTFDYVFLFSVYHHLYRHEGATVAESILRQLAEKTSRTLFFEPASRTEWYGDDNLGFEDGNVDSIIEYNTDMLHDVIDRDIRVEHLGSRVQGTRGERCLFAVHML